MIFFIYKQPKNWNFGKVGAQKLNQQSGAEATQLEQVG